MNYFKRADKNRDILDAYDHAQEGSQKNQWTVRYFHGSKSTQRFRSVPFAENMGTVLLDQGCSKQSIHHPPETE